MNLALQQAILCIDEDEVPVGCVIVKDDVVLGFGRNSREKENSVLGHAEINAIKMASSKLNDYQLVDCDIYVTLEPCMMCMGAIIQSRIRNLYFGAYDLKQGMAVTQYQINNQDFFNHKVNVEGGILEDECKNIIQAYFKEKRKTKIAK